MDITKINFKCMSGLTKKLLRYHFKLQEPKCMTHTSYLPPIEMYSVSVVDDLCERLAKSQIECLKLKAELEKIKNDPHLLLTIQDT